MDLLSRIEIYSAMPYKGGKDSSIDDWFHVARNEPKEHVEAIWDIESLFRPEIDDKDKPIRLLSIESHFDEIRLHYALNYTSWRYHEDLLIWALKALKPGGKLQIISPDSEWILRHWLADALLLDPEKYQTADQLEELQKENEQLKRENEQLRQQLNILKAPWWQLNKRRKNKVKQMLEDAGVPTDLLPQITHDEIAKSVPDLVMKEVKQDWEFDLWLLQQLYSSGAGEPQDTFKAIFNKRYLSVLLHRTQFVTKLLQNNPNNPMQIEAEAIKHPSRLFFSPNIKEMQNESSN